MDRDAFAGFYERSSPALRAYLVRVSGNSALADDLLQESYLRFLCASQPEGGEVNFRRYLFRIATNLLKDHWRRPKTGGLEDIPQALHESKVLAKVALLIGGAAGVLWAGICTLKKCLRPSIDRHDSIDAAEKK